MTKTTDTVRRRPSWPTLIALALLAVVPLAAPQFWVTLGNYIGLYSIATLGLVLLTGVAGQTSFGQAAFVGIGGYVTAILATRFGISPWLNLIAGLAVVFVVALLIGFITLRMRGHYLPLATIAWGVAFYYLFGDLDALGGHTGITGIPALSLFGFELRDERRYFWLIWAFALAALWATHNLLDSRAGRAIRAQKSASAMAEAFAVDGARLKIVVFVYAALLGGISGWLYAHLQRFVNPTPFGIHQGIEYLFMAVVGGAASVFGAVIGATIITVAKEFLQDVLPHILGRSGNFEMVVFGVLMVVLLQHASDGVGPWIARRMPSRRRRNLPDALPLPHHAPRATSGPLLEVRSARKAFGGLIAVDDVSFEVAEGTLVALIGPNGAGKTTMFNLISGALEPARGEILFRGAPIAGRPPFEIARHGIARTFQHVKLIAGMSVLDNVALGAYRRGTAGVLRCALTLDRDEEARTRATALAALGRVGLAAEAGAVATSLALGRQRIVEIARALAADPTLLLLDEPAAGLRYAEKQELAATLARLRTEGLTILLVEHDMDFVMGLADRVVVMDFGEKLAAGLPAEIQRDPRVREAYLGGVL